MHKASKSGLHSRPLYISAALLTAISSYGIQPEASAFAGLENSGVRATALPLLVPQAGPNVELIPDRYIVTTRSSAKPRIATRELFSGPMNGFVADLTQSQLSELRRSSEVLSIEQDAWHHNAVETTQSPVPSWGIDRIDQAKLPLSNSYTYNATGAGVHVYVIDSGIYPEQPDFGGRASFDYNAIDGNNTDCRNHGTPVAGIIGSATYGVAKQARLHGVKMLDCAGSGTTSAAVSAVNWVAANRIAPAVANTSWNLAYSATLETALRRMIGAGVFLTTSGGNTGGDSCDRLPRSIGGALAVAASTRNDSRASFSSTGNCIDVYAPGSEVITTHGPGSGSTVIFDGTSAAAPHAAGAAALYKQTYGNQSQSAIHAWIVDNSSTGKLGGNLFGTPNRILNIRQL